MSPFYHDICGDKMVKLMALSVRLEPEERDALEVAARDHNRKLSDLARLCIVGWLRQNGYLQDGDRTGPD
jgi:hypothetical protein